MDEVVYKDPTPKTMKDLKRRLKQAWKKIPLSTSRYMTFYPTPCRNGLGTWYQTKEGMLDIDFPNICNQ